MPLSILTPLAAWLPPERIVFAHNLACERSRAAPGSRIALPFPCYIHRALREIPRLSRRTMALLNDSAESLLLLDARSADTIGTWARAQPLGAGGADVGVRDVCRLQLQPLIA
jgi:hypothetical protein